MLKEIEAAITERLKPLETSETPLKIFNSPRQFRAKPEAALLCYFDNQSPVGNPADAVMAKPSVAMRLLRYAMLLRVKDLTTHTSVYPYIEAIQQLLIGFIPVPGLTKRLYFLSNDFVDYEDGFWVYGMQFAVEAEYSQFERLKDWNLELYR